MFDNYLIRRGTLQNEVDPATGAVVGFKFGVKIADYRGTFLSLHNGYFIVVDGEEYPRALQTFEVNGKRPRSFDELRTCVWEHWDCTDMAWVHVKKPGGLSKGVHRVGLQQSILSYYGYSDHDQEWIDHPPVPGKTGAGKMTHTRYFDLEVV